MSLKNVSCQLYFYLSVCRPYSINNNLYLRFHHTPASSTPTQVISLNCSINAANTIQLELSYEINLLKRAHFLSMLPSPPYLPLNCNHLFMVCYKMGSQSLTAMVCQEAHSTDMETEKTKQGQLTSHDHYYSISRCTVTSLTSTPRFKRCLFKALPFRNSEGVINRNYRSRDLYV
jgi:hypothetical protein